MAHSENMAQKSDYQLKWITANVSSYPENQIKAALEELERRGEINSKAENIKNNFKMLRDIIYKFFK